MSSGLHSKTEIRRLEFLTHIYSLNSVSNLFQVLLDQLPNLVDCDNVMIARHHGPSRSISSVILRHPFSKEQFLPFVHEAGYLKTYPLWETLLCEQREVGVLSDPSQCLVKWLNHPLYREVMRVDNVVDQMFMPLGPDLEAFVTVSVIRDKCGFSKTDRETFRILRQHVYQALLNSRKLDALGLLSCDRRWQDEGVWLDLRGQVCASALGANGRFSPVIERILRTAPDDFERWLQAGLDQLNRGCQDAEGGVFVPLFETNVNIHLMRGSEEANYPYMLACRKPPLSLPLEAITERESEVLGWVGEGKTNHEIAVIMGIGSETVKSHLKQIFRKLDVDNRTAAASLARKL